MNKDQAKGSVKDAAGKAQAKLGRVAGAQDQEAKGQARRTEGKVQGKLGDVKQAAKGLVKKR